MIYQPSNAIVERLRAMFKRRVRDAELAYLGDTHGEGARVDVPGRIGFVYIHFANGKDENGFARYSGPTMARSANAAYLNAPGMPVFVAYNDAGELEIKGAQLAALDQAGFDTRVLNPLNQQSKFVYPWQLTYGMASAVANSVTTSFLVTVKKFYHLVGNKLEAFDTPLEADKIDMEAYIPAADMHCYAAVWIDTFLNEAVVTTSVAQAMTTPLDITDLQELVVRAASSRPPDGVSLKAFYLANDQGTLKQSSLEVDLRQHMDMPQAWGFPNVLSTLERIWPNRTLVTGPFTTTGVGALDTSESGARHIIVHKNNFVGMAAPDVTDDSDDGYSIGSLWFDTSTGLLYVATDVTVGAAVWDEVASSGSGGITELTGDVTAGPGSGSQVATIADGAITLPKLSDGTPGSLIGFASDGSPIEKTVIISSSDGTLDVTYNATDTEISYDLAIPDKTIGVNDRTAQWGEAMTIHQLVFKSPSDGKWYKADRDAAGPLIARERGIVIDAGTGLINAIGVVRVHGPVGGFSSLTNGGPVYLDTTAGGYTQTEPVPSLAGATVICARYGYASSTTEIFVERAPVLHLRRASLADGATLTVSHYADSTTNRLREPSAAISTDETGILETSGGTRDSSRQLKGQSGAGTTTTPDSVGAQVSAVGDSGGNELKVAQSMTFANAGILASAIIRAGATTGSPTGFPTVSLQTDNAGVPSGTILDTVTLSSWTPSADNPVTFTGGVFLSTATTYWLVVEAPAQSTGVFFTVGRNNANPYANGQMKGHTSADPGGWAFIPAGNDMRCSVTLAAIVLNDGLAQGFSHASTTTVASATLLLKRTGALASDDLTLAIYDDSGGLPGSVITNGTAATVAASSVGTSFGNVTFTWGTDPTITASTQYHLVLTTSGSASNTAYIEWGIDVSSPPYANGVFEVLQSSSWAADSPAADGIFTLSGILSTYGEPASIGRWGGSIGRDFGVRYDNGSGSNLTTNTTFKNTSGVTLDAVCCVEMP